MKKFLFLFILIPALTNSQPEIQKSKKIYIEKKVEGGFRFYNSDKELLYEFTSRNTDSLSLSTLEDIFEGLSTEENKPISVIIDNIPEPESGWVEVFKIVFATVIGGLILWLFQYFTQVKQNRKQEFENRINSYLEHQQYILNDIKVDVSISQGTYSPEKWNRYEGRDFFIFSRYLLREMYSFLLQPYAVQEFAERLATDVITVDSLVQLHDEFPFRNELDDGEYIPTKDKELQISRLLYEFYFTHYKDHIGHYFRHLYNILDYISEKKKMFGRKSKEPQFLADMIQARLSAAELFMLFYNGIIPGFKKMYNEITTYNVIENLAKQDLLNPDIHPDFYPECKMKSMENLLVERTDIN